MHHNDDDALEDTEPSIDLSQFFTTAPDTGKINEPERGQSAPTKSQADNAVNQFTTILQTTTEKEETNSFVLFTTKKVGKRDVVVFVGVQIVV